MKRPLQADEIIALIMAIIGIGIVPFITNASNLLSTLGQIAVFYLLICVAARKFDDVQRKYHGGNKTKRD